MRIVFFVHTLGRTRHFTDVIRGLAERGHTVVLAGKSEAKPTKAGVYIHPRVEIAACPTQRSDRWQSAVDPLRRARDAMRFFDPRNAEAARVAERAAENAPSGWNRAFERYAWLRRHWKTVERALAVVEAVTPCDAEFSRFLEEQRADVVLVTPLVEFGSYQTDYVKCAHRAGIPVLYLPFSWDNLTNRGLIRVTPDRALVWNAHQRREAIELHDVPPERIVITGAPRFDAFFRMKPSTTREAFCADLGFVPARPLILYVCSSNFIAPREVKFVRRWVGALRAAGGWLGECNVLIRPHPANEKDWRSADLSDLDGVTVWTKKATLNGDQGLFDSLHHAAAVVGVNTSAMIEAAIVGRPVFTIATRQVAGGQGGTIHFSYLPIENGGIVSMSHSFEEHTRQLVATPDDADVAERSRRFLSSFVRPRGLDTPVSPQMVEEIERAATIDKRPYRSPPWHYPLRWSLAAALRAGFDPALGR